MSDWYVTDCDGIVRWMQAISFKYLRSSHLRTLVTNLFVPCDAVTVALFGISTDVRAHSVVSFNSFHWVLVYMDVCICTCICVCVYICIVVWAVAVLILLSAVV